MGTPQMLMAMASLFCMSLNQLHVLILTSKTVVTTHANLAVLDAAFDSVLVTLVTFLGLLQAMHLSNMLNIDIPLHKEATLQQFYQPKNLCLDAKLLSSHGAQDITKVMGY
jgi:hypothetical protein